MEVLDLLRLQHDQFAAGGSGRPAEAVSPDPDVRLWQGRQVFGEATTEVCGHLHQGLMVRKETKGAVLDALYLFLHLIGFSVGTGAAAVYESQLPRTRRNAAEAPQPAAMAMANDIRP